MVGFLSGGGFGDVPSEMCWSRRLFASLYPGQPEALSQRGYPEGPERLLGADQGFGRFSVNVPLSNRLS